MPNDPILHMLGLARKAGRLEIGEEPVGAACRARQAKLVLLACDAASNTFRRAAHFGEAGNVLWLEVPFTKAELGFALGRGSCAMLALTDVGFASSLVQKLSARDPEKYGPAAQQLKAKADKTLQRQREKRQHEKNLREGKQRKPWAVPPREQEKPSAPKKPKAARKSSGPARGTPGKREDGPKRSARPSGLSKAGPGGRKLSGKFRHHP